MIPLTVGEIADAVDGRLAGGASPADVVLGQVVIDSRQVLAGALFVAILGEHHDGHEFAHVASDSGAVAVLSSRELDVPCVVVPDTVVALGRLARHVVDGFPELVVVAVTGSSGKTSTKDLLVRTMPLLGATVAPVGSFNNEIGVPLTALGVQPDTRILVSEMGSRGIGHIRYLMGITPPRVGIVLNVGSAHIGEFGGREMIAQAKGELVEGLPDADAGGVAVLNADDPLVLSMRARTAARVVTFGESADADVRAVGVALDAAARPSFDLVHEGRSARVRMRLHGRHHVSNALATAAAALALGAGLEEVAVRLSEAGPASRWRMDVTETVSGVTVVNDAYNANPESVRAALEALVAMSVPTDLAPNRRSWAVLGEMRELGDVSRAEHEAIGRLAVELGIDRVVVVGEAAHPVLDGVVRAGGTQERAVVVPDADAAVSLLRAEILRGDVILVKASRAAGLERVGQALMEESA